MAVEVKAGKVQTGPKISASRGRSCGRLSFCPEDECCLMLRCLMVMLEGVAVVVRCRKALA
jgi:hypothetical protein